MRTRDDLSTTSDEVGYYLCVNDITAGARCSNANTAPLFTSLYSITMPEVISSDGRVMVIDTDSINYVRVGETFVFPAANVSKRRLPRGTLHRNVAAVNSARVL